MFRFLAKLFEEAPLPLPFDHPALGHFEFHRDLGWTVRLKLDGREVEFHLGSKALPTKEMLATAVAWQQEWPARVAAVRDYIRRYLATWPANAVKPDPDKFEIHAVMISRSERPMAGMIFMRNPGDDFNWHIDFQGLQLFGIAFDS